MANYIINECLTNDQYVVSAVTLSVGITIRFFIGETSFCGTVGSVTESPITEYSYVDAQFTDCCECLSNDGRESLNFQFIACNTLLEINIEAFNFCREHGLPITGMTYELQLASYVPFCATFTGLASTGETNYHYVSGPFSVCEDCGEEPPRSANTEYEVCEICCDCGATGSTINLITPPHPVYTDGYGTPVTQLNMVVLGGPNGLNS